MPIDKRQGYCENCSRNVMAERKGTNHLLHLILCIPTAGLWLVMWIMCALLKNPFRCTVCGEKTKRARDMAKARG